MRSVELERDDKQKSTYTTRKKLVFWDGLHHSAITGESGFTKEEYRVLLVEAGFQLSSVTPTNRRSVLSKASHYRAVVEWWSGGVVEWGSGE